MLKLLKYDQYKHAPSTGKSETIEIIKDSLPHRNASIEAKLLDDYKSDNLRCEILAKIVTPANNNDI